MEARHESKPSIALIDGVRLASLVLRNGVAEADGEDALWAG